MIIQRLSASAFLCEIIDNTIFICVYNLDTNIMKEISPTSATPILLTSDIKCVLHAFINTHITIYIYTDVLVVERFLHVHYNIPIFVKYI